MERGGFPRSPSSGNRAFDEYRMETLRRLEEEQHEFRDFLDRLRHAKDKEEFDQFMAQHRPRPLHRPTTVPKADTKAPSLRPKCPLRLKAIEPPACPKQAGGLICAPKTALPSRL